MNCAIYACAAAAPAAAVNVVAVVAAQATAPAALPQVLVWMYPLYSSRAATNRGSKRGIRPY